MERSLHSPTDPEEHERDRSNNGVRFKTQTRSTSERKNVGVSHETNVIDGAFEERSPDASPLAEELKRDLPESPEIDEDKVLADEENQSFVNNMEILRDIYRPDDGTACTYRRILYQEDAYFDGGVIHIEDYWSGEEDEDEDEDDDEDLEEDEEDLEDNEGDTHDCDEHVVNDVDNLENEANDEQVGNKPQSSSFIKPAKADVDQFDVSSRKKSNDENRDSVASNSSCSEQTSCNKLRKRTIEASGDNVPVKNRKNEDGDSKLGSFIDASGQRRSRRNVKGKK